MTSADYSLLAYQTTMQAFLPLGSDSIQVDKLARLFEKTDTSYKFLWFLAILDEFKLGMPEHGQAYHCMPFKLLVKRMLERAHLYTHHYKLFLGHRDKLDEHMASVIKASGEKMGRRTDNLDIMTYRYFWRDIKINERTKEFTRLVTYVPRRLLVPFLTSSIKAKKRKEKRAAIDGEFGHGWREMEQPPLYFYSYSKSEIEVPAQWYRYLSKHHSILEQWTLWNLSCFLSRRNPNVPGIDLKLMVSKRGGMQLQRHLWKLAWDKHAGSLLCPYTGELLPAKHALDHFIPHSFVHHDQLWNLVPTSKEINSSKSDQLPNLQKTMPNFLNMQEVIINILLEQLEHREKKFDKFIVSYQNDVFEGEEMNTMIQYKDKMREKLNSVIKRNHAAATSQGFPVWR